MDPVQKAKLDHLLSGLDPAIPNFVIYLIQSHVHGGYKLGIPSEFRSENKFAKNDLLVTLVDENGNVCTAKYLAGQRCLSAGWRGFAKGHDVVVGDAVVFQLINIDTFKVFIVKKTVRKTGLAEVGGAFGLPPPEACAQESSLGKTGSDMKPMRKTVSGKHKRLPLSVNEGENENTSPPQSVKPRSKYKSPMMNRKVKFIEATQLAGIRNILSSLDLGNPSFVILMLKTHVEESFEMVIPVAISSQHMPNKDIEVTLLDEIGGEEIVDYRHKRNSLAGKGWKRFVKKHNLAVEDAVVFQIMKSNKFKVFIVKKTPEVGGAFGRPPPEACAQESSLGKGGSAMKEIVRETGLAEVDGAPQPEACARKSSLGVSPSDCSISVPTRETVMGKPKRLHSSVIEGENERISPPQSVIDQPENCSEKAHLDYLKDLRSARKVPEFKDIKNIDEFTIVYNKLTLDLVLSPCAKSRYYELCCSQKSFLHKTLLPGLNFHIAVGLISETVNIADAIKSSQVRCASRNELRKWRQTLEGFKVLGMNVGFLLSPLEELLKLSKKRSNRSEEKSKAVHLKKKKKMRI